MVIDTAIERALALPWELRVEEVCVGHASTYVSVRGTDGLRAMGVVLTPRDEAGPRELREPPRVPLEWEECRVEDLIRLGTSLHVFERAIGVAALNAVSQVRIRRGETAGILSWGRGRNPHREFLLEQIRPEDRVVFIGNLAPLVEAVRARGVEPLVFERSAALRPGAYSDAFEYRHLPQADVVIATGAVLLNDTLEPILSFSPRARERILVGFSGQVHPEFLAGSGVTHVASLLIEDVERVRRALQLTHWNKMFEERSYIAPVQ